MRKPNIVPAGCPTDTYKTKMTFDELLKYALRFRPDQIIWGKSAESRRDTTRFIQYWPCGINGYDTANSAEKALTASPIS